MISTEVEKGNLIPTEHDSCVFLTGSKCDGQTTTWILLQQVVDGQTPPRYYPHVSIKYPSGYFYTQYSLWMLLSGCVP